MTDAVVQYKDERDKTVVYAGLEVIGEIIRVDGGWQYQSASNPGAASPLFPSRNKVKDALSFRRFADGEREAEDYEMLSGDDKITGVTQRSVGEDG